VRGAVAHTETLFFGGGKRIRPYVAALAYASAGHTKPSRSLNQLCLGLELFHLFGLMHDDIIDRSDLRHGVATLHAWLRSHMDAHTATSQAILVGDLVFSWSSELVHRVGHTLRPEWRALMFAAYAQMVEEVFIGQMLDVDTTIHAAVSDRDILEKTRLKTSRYTFIGPIRLGGALGGQDLTAFAEPFGTAIGLAFQIQDDLLDIVSDSAVLQKPGLGDLAEHQHTFFTQYLEKQAAPSFQKRWRDIRAAGEYDSAEVRTLFQEAGAVRAGERRIKHYVREAREVVAASPFPEARKSEWSALIDLIALRSH
jgi:geranylgeranyl diphosphate synthase type I